MLIHTYCPIDGTDEADTEVYPATFTEADLTPEVFSARRTPDRVHYRMVRNTRTGCLRADPILDDETVASLYRASSVTDTDTADLAAEVYAHYLGKALAALPDKRGALEIGCGHGVFLERLQDSGFDTVQGVELSVQAVEQASPSVASCIDTRPLAADSYPAGSFSLACGFQVLDHLTDPNGMLQSCRDVLCDNGIMYWICHDIGSLPARMLGRRCPMLDVEHVVLYDRRTLRALFEKNGYEVIDLFGVRNRYPLSYWTRLAPLPEAVRSAALKVLSATGLGQWRLSVNFGNMGVIARKQP